MKYIKNLLIFISLFLLFIFKDYFYVIPLNLLNININNLSQNIKLLLSLYSSLVLAVIIIIIYHKYLKEKLIEYKKHFSEYFDLGLKYYMIGLFGMFFFNILIPIISPVKEANNEALVQEMLKQAPLLTFISASLFAPFLEEMLFRKSFGDIFQNKKIMVLASGLFFGLLHVIFSIKTPWDLLYILPYGMLGGGFAYTIYKQDNIYIPMTFHMLHNGFLTILSILLTVLK